MDFTIIIYQQLLNTLLSQGFSFITVATYAEAKTEVKVKVKVEPTWLTNQSDLSNSFSQSDRVEGDSAQLQPEFSIQTQPLFSSEPQPEPQPFSSAQPQPEPEPFFSSQPCHAERSRSAQPFILLRHDVEAKYGNALKIARVQHQMGIKGTYFFRIYPHRGNEEVIREIAAMGHEIGYHYDDLSECKGDYEKAIQRFQQNLEYLSEKSEESEE